MTAQENLSGFGASGGASESVPQPQDFFEQNLGKFINYALSKGATYNEEEDILVFKGEVLAKPVKIYLREETYASLRPLSDIEIIREFRYLISRRNLERFRNYAASQGAYFDARGYLIYQGKVLSKADSEYIAQTEEEEQRLLTDEEIQAAFNNLVSYAEESEEGEGDE